MTIFTHIYHTVLRKSLVGSEIRGRPSGDGGQWMEQSGEGASPCWSVDRRRKHGGNENIQNFQWLPASPIGAHQYAQLLAAFDRSGVSAAAFARRHGLNYTTFCG